MNNRNQKWLWIVLIIILIVLIIWAIVAAYSHQSGNIGGEAGSSTSATNQSALEGGNSSQNNGSGKNPFVVPPTTKSHPVISSLNPTSGRSGINVSVSGSGFDLTTNYVEFSGFNLGAVGSSDGKHLNFNLPATIKSCTNGNCTNNNVPVGPGSYTVAVRNAKGTSNVVYFMVTSAGPTQ